jgi:molybdenum-dependent DNA-binding transcriptional regulator ModE
MTHPSPAPRADNTRWTGAKASAFLKLLARTGKVAPAARSVGMSRQSAYRLRARAPEFAKYWDTAMEVAANRKASAGRGRRRTPVHPLLAKAPVTQWPDCDAPGGVG